MILFSKLMSWFSRITGFLVGASSLTGVLGLAIVIFGLYYWKEYARIPKPTDRSVLRRDPNQQPSTSGTSRHPSTQTSPPPPQTATKSRQTNTSIRRITISVPGTLISETLPSHLLEGATIIPAAATALQHATTLADIFLMAHVDDDIGEAVVRGALEHAGLIGHAKGQIYPHRLLFCDTIDGKTSLVRQLDSQLHIDAHPTTVHQLQRFVPHIASVISSKYSSLDDTGPSSSAAIGPLSQNVVVVDSLNTAIHTFF